MKRYKKFIPNLWQSDVEPIEAFPLTPSIKIELAKRCLQFMRDIAGRASREYSRTTELHRAVGAVLARVSAASASGLEADGEAELAERFRHACRRRSGPYPGNIGASGLADRGAGRSGQSAWIASNYADL